MPAFKPESVGQGIAKVEQKGNEIFIFLSYNRYEYTFYLFVYLYYYTLSIFMINLRNQYSKGLVFKWYQPFE